MIWRMILCLFIFKITHEILLMIIYEVILLKSFTFCDKGLTILRSICHLWQARGSEIALNLIIKPSREYPPRYKFDMNVYTADREVH